MLGASTPGTLATVSKDVSFATRRRSLPPITGGFLALSYPTVLVIAALSTGFSRGGDMTEFAATLAGAVMFLIAAPTAWVLSFSFIEVTRFTVLVFGIVTSAPLWYIVGVSLARSADRWNVWMRRYAVACVCWTAANLVLFGAIASLSG